MLDLRDKQPKLFAGREINLASNHRSLCISRKGAKNHDRVFFAPWRLCVLEGLLILLCGRRAKAAAPWCFNRQYIARLDPGLRNCRQYNMRAVAADKDVA